MNHKHKDSHKTSDCVVAFLHPPLPSHLERRHAAPVSFDSRKMCFDILSIYQSLYLGMEDLFQCHLQCVEKVQCDP